MDATGRRRQSDSRRLGGNGPEPTPQRHAARPRAHHQRVEQRQFRAGGTGENNLRAAPTEEWVGYDYTPDSCGGHLWGYDAFDRFEAGVNAVADGGTVFVVSGTYEGSFTAPSGKTVTVAIGNSPGQALSFTATATDPDQPANLLTFSLPNPPPGAVIDAAGLFTWRPGVALAGSANTVHVQVTDDGAPLLSDTDSFLVIVNPLSAPVVLTPVAWSEGQFSFSITGPIGPDYVVQVSSDLTTWPTLHTATPSTMPYHFTDTDAGAGRRFYRVQLGP